MASTPSSPDTITISRTELADMIKDAVASSRASELASLGEQIGQSVATGMAKNQRRKVPYGEYIRKTHSTSHPDPDFPNGPALTRVCWVNGAFVDVATHQDSEIRLLNRLTHSGRYLNRLVEVIVQHNGSDEEVQIRWNAKTPDDRFELGKYAVSFVDMLEKIVAVQQEEDAEQAQLTEEKQQRKRMFGQKRSTLEAEARAASID
jgi:hypothetical protein